MKLGVIARADDRGLAHQTWEVVRHLHPERVLVLRIASSERRGHAFDPDRFPDAMVLTVDDSSPDWRLPERDVRAWLDGLDVVYTAETFYDDRIATWARQQGVATVIHANPEWYRHHRGGIPHPTAWWSATTWRHNHLPIGTRVVPMPVPTDRWPDQCASTERSVFHPAGVVAAKDRNGTDLVMQTAALLPDVEFILSAQEGLKISTDAPNVRLEVPAANYWKAHGIAPVMLLPRRYGGLCLPVIEACGAGVVPVLPDCQPNDTWPAVLVPSSPAGTLRCQGGEIQLYATTPTDLATAVSDALDNIDAHRARVAEWAHANSWEALAPLWRAELQMVADAYEPQPEPRTTVAFTRPRASVSVLIPCTEDRRDVHDWIVRRWRAEHPDWEVISSRLDGEWCKARAVKAAADIASGSVLVVADCDSYVSAEAMNEAASLAAAGRWVVPHRMIYRLDGNTTKHLLRADPPGDLEHRNASLVKHAYEATPGGGVTVLPRAMWEDCPLDDRFVGYGFEDYAWGDALTTLHGRPVLLGADLVHLWHEPLDGRRKSNETVELRQTYRAALGSPRLMRALVDRVDPPEPTPLDRPATFTCDNHRLRIKTPHGYVQFRSGNYSTTNEDLAAVLRLNPHVTEVV